MSPHKSLTDPLCNAKNFSLKFYLHFLSPDSYYRATKTSCVKGFPLANYSWTQTSISPIPRFAHA